MSGATEDIEVRLRNLYRLSGFTAPQVRQVERLLKRIGRRTKASDIEGEFLIAVDLANRIGKKRGVGYDQNQYADPLTVIDSLEKYSLTDLPTIISAVLYPVLRPEAGKPFDPEIFAEIEHQYINKPEIPSIIRETLQIRDIHLLTRIGSQVAFVPSETPKKEWLEAFCRMIKNKMTDQFARPFLIRCTQFLIFCQTIDENTAPEIRNQATYMLENFYIPMCGALGFSGFLDTTFDSTKHISLRQRQKDKSFSELQRELQNQLFRLTEPENFEKAHHVIEAAEDAILSMIGKDSIVAKESRGDPPRRLITNPSARSRIAKETIQKIFEGALPTDIEVIDAEEDLSEYTSVVYTRVRLKTEKSLWDKTFRKPGHVISDVIGIQVIGLDDDDERRLASRIHKQVSTNLERNGHVKLEGAEDDLMGREGKGQRRNPDYVPAPRHESRKNKAPDRKAIGARKGYEAIHSSWRLKSIAFPDIVLNGNPVRIGVAEAQYIGHSIDLENTYGIAAHNAIYKPSSTSFDPDLDNKVVFFIPGNSGMDIVELPRGSTPRDCAASLGIVSGLEGATLSRNDLFSPMTGDQDSLLDQPIETGDIVDILLSPTAVITSRKSSLHLVQG